MTAPTPADVAGRRPRPEPVFDPHRPEDGAAETPAQRRARRRDDVIVAAERFQSAARGLRCWHEDLDLNLEAYARARHRLDAAIDALEDELDKAPNLPAPHQS